MVNPNSFMSLKLRFFYFLLMFVYQKFLYIEKRWNQLGKWLQLSSTNRNWKLH
jgi:hypothetical protein